MHGHRFFSTSNYMYLHFLCGYYKYIIAEAYSIAISDLVTQRLQSRSIFV